MTHRQPKLPLALRIIAAGCVVLWLAGVSACTLESLLCSDWHDNEAVAHADQGRSHDAESADAEAHQAHDANVHSQDAEAHHSPDAEGHSRGSHKHDGKEGSCCSTLKAVVQTAKSIVVPKQVLQPVVLLCVLLEGRIFALDRPDTASTRPPPRGEWVITPEVCTGPANRSHAPPASV